MDATNVEGTRNILDWVLSSQSRVRVLTVSSAALYGKGGLGLEEHESISEPSSDYGASKRAQLEVVWDAQKKGLEIIDIRPFNFAGPGIPEGLLVGDLCKEVVRRERQGEGGPLRVRSPLCKRDFVDIRDAARAVPLTAEKGVPGEVYHVSSGVGVSVLDVAQRLIQFAKVRIQLDPDYGSSAAPMVSCGSYLKLNRATGWEPSVSLDDSLLDALEGWRSIK